MSFVIYDVETTGLTKRFDQIVQFAAVLTDSDLNVKDRIEIDCRLMPHVIPSPKAMHVTRLPIEQLLNASLPSHYEMVTEIRRILESWSPALFLGFNSVSFDEEFLRQAFYLCLYNPYLTNTRGNARADVLNLCRMTAALRPDVIRYAIDENGRPIFKLKPLAEANGITVPMSHSALADVFTTLALCQSIKDRAPDVWSQFLRFSKKATVESFITDEDAFVVSETIGNTHRARVVTQIGRHAKQQARHYCLDVSTDLDPLREMSVGELVNLCRGSARPIVTIRTNAAPTLWALYEATQDHLTPFEDEAEVLERVELVREDRDFLEQLRNAAQSAEPDYPPSPHLEEQIYGHPFASRRDEELMHDFHADSWEERPALALQFSDSRYRRLALRLIYFERPDLLTSERQTAVDNAMRKRLISAPDADVPWRSISAAKRDLKALLASGLRQGETMRQMRYLNYLKERADTLVLSKSVVRR
ncbi:exonuclease domain-containing protein [Candidatus Rariloculus sp.]|uniref:exonuclease domain-containing protein n=1 Tax=Candidatus Rariloculus sp. TaxID=3101265 RepID=UPI003D14E31C